MSEAVLNDKQAARNYSQSIVDSLDPVVYRMLADGGGMKISERNWDIPRALCESEVMEMLMKALVTWMQHYRLSIYRQEIQEML